MFHRKRVCSAPHVPVGSQAELFQLRLGIALAVAEQPRDGVPMGIRRGGADRFPRRKLARP